MQRFRCLLAFFTCLLSASPALTQTGAQPETERITLGQSVVPLYGPWKFTIGDSPIDPATHAPLWAEPGFDDTHWETVSLKSKTGATDPIGGFSDYVPGWTSLGHPGYWGYAWYRLRIQVTALPGQRLAIAGPVDVDDIYQVFAGGSMIGSFGDFSGTRPNEYFTQPRMFLLPSGQADSGTMVLAFRLWMGPQTLYDPDVGGFHTAPRFGNAAAVSAEYQLLWIQLIRHYGAAPILCIVFLVLAVLAFSLVLFDRSDSVYLWMGGVFLVTAVHNGFTVAAQTTEWTSIHVTTFTENVFLNPLSYVFWVMVWWTWFRLQRPVWVPRLVAGITVVQFLFSLAVHQRLYGATVKSYTSGFFLEQSILDLVCLLVLVGVVILGIRKQGAEGWLALPAVLLVSVSQFDADLLRFGVQTSIFPFGVRFRLYDIAVLLLAATLSLLLLRRLLLSVREQRLLAVDVKQAQEVQQVILPQAITAYPGLVIENEYRPAREVGGDFYQVVPHATDGSLLIVAGDVAGKGLRAGMLVALLVGAIRSTTEVNPDPLFVLGALNRRLLGRGDAHATCLAMRIAADGAVTLANAGHMPPYLNGKAIDMQGALPLGSMEGPEFSVMHFQLKPDDRLVLASDGIVEAMDEKGQLFGFARLQQLLLSKSTAAQMASAAQSFGQADDISVIAVTRQGSMMPA